MKRLFVFLSFCLAVFLCDCKKTTNLPVTQLDDTAATFYINFKPGTYWIYRDTISGRTDSFFVRSNTFISQPDQTQTYEYHNITVAGHNLDGTDLADSTLWVWDYEYPSINLNYYYGQGPLGWRHDAQYMPLYNFPLDPKTIGYFTTQNDTASMVNVLYLDSVNHIPVSPLYEIEHHILADTVANPTLMTFNDQFYLNDTLGIVMMHLYHPSQGINRVWRLVRYKIVK
jgi:hypothetical protein